MNLRTFRFALAGLAMLCAAETAGAVTKTWTLNAEFDEGVLFNVNHTDVADQLQLNQTTRPFPFVNIACSQRGTIVRIDVNTGAILGEYFTAPNGMGRNPSRTTVDRFGNVWVSNRDEGGFSNGQPRGSIARIGLVIGGTRCLADGTPDPAGQYLKPPFDYSTVADRDGDGLIKTSFGLGNLLPWTNAGGVDTHGGVATADDEAIVNYTRITGTNARTVAIDANNDVWTGGLGDLDHEKVSGVTGLPIAGTQFNLGCGGYGGLVDGNNVLWSARGGGGLLRYDANTASGVCYGVSRGDYGLGVDPNTGEIWQTTLGNGVTYKLDPAGNVLGVFGHGNSWAQGVVVDGSGNVWVAHSLFGATTVGHLRTDGTFVGNVSLPGGNGPTGVAVDANGKIWVANINSNNAQRIDPTAGPIGGGGFPVGAVDLTVDLGPGAGPYNYSDMTGFVSIGATAPFGTWTVVYDGGAPGVIWDDVSWNDLVPAGTSVTVEVRAADTQVALAGESFVPTTNGGALAGIDGQFIEIRAALSRDASAPTPVLYDLTVRSRGGKPVCDNCPRSPGFWSQQCAQRGNGSTKLSMTQVIAVAECVNERSDFFAWAPGSEFDRLCTNLNPQRPMNVRKQAHRQFAAFMANICAIEVPESGVCLDPGTPIDCNGFAAGTLGELADEVDALLNKLFAGSLSDPAVSGGYGRIIACLDGINNGVGIGPTCGGDAILAAEHEATGTRGRLADPDQGIVPAETFLYCASEFDPTALDVEENVTRSPIVEGTLEGVHVYPNPTPMSRGATVAFTVPAGGASAQVDVFAVNGRKVATLVSGELEAGVHRVSWNGRVSDETGLVPGLYFVRARIGATVSTRQFIVIR